LTVFEDYTLNVELFRWINSHHTVFLDRFFMLFSYLGSGWVLIVCFFYLFYKKDWQKTKALSLAVVMESFIVWALKFTLTQPRPSRLLKDVHLLVPLHTNSFPSADTALAFVIASVFGYVAKKYTKVLLGVYAIGIGYERIYLGVHFPLDVVAGAIIGLVSGYIACRLFT